MLADAQIWIAGMVNVSGAAPGGALASVTVFNSLSWERSDVVLDLAPPSGSGPVWVVTAGGGLVHSQLSADGTAIVFAAEKVPSFGFATFFLVPALAAPAAPLPARSVVGTPWTTIWSNEFFRLTPGAGGLASIVDLASGVSLFDTAHYDVGEWMEQVKQSANAPAARRPPPTPNLPCPKIGGDRDPHARTKIPAQSLDYIGRKYNR